ncbi:glucose-1-phosphate thymidylyltransferase RfbA [Aeromonas bestiarum]|uniref:glucose-1-phosphate thymidylyltransferase RfbA n=1 Tax=Aeromonas bestiarum TaxID=105751 RepID=UPI000A039985|nr:glucose-1-phosphate thymidylyltransferase RfbA [Aeromonas bestiarum]
MRTKSTQQFRKGIILAGGSGSRLYPATLAVSKQLLPVYDKPMIYYPLSTLMLTGIREILIITTEVDMPRFQLLLGNGRQWGLTLSYTVQQQPQGIAQALLIAEEFLAGHPCCLILGDNLFYGADLAKQLQRANRISTGAGIFAYHVNDPERYGVLSFDKMGTVIAITEKPAVPKSHFVVTGLYFYDEQASSLAKQLVLSDREELEITDLNWLYLERGELDITFIGRGCAWLDTGTHDSLQEAGSFIQTLEKRQGLKVGCPEEIAWRQSWIDDMRLRELAIPLKNSGYGKYLLRLLEPSFGCHENSLD